jgi:hypothetical protein
MTVAHWRLVPGYCLVATIYRIRTKIPDFAADGPCYRSLKLNDCFAKGDGQHNCGIYGWDRALITRWLLLSEWPGVVHLLLHCPQTAVVTLKLRLDQWCHDPVDWWKKYWYSSLHFHYKWWNELVKGRQFIFLYFCETIKISWNMIKKLWYHCLFSYNISMDNKLKNQAQKLPLSPGVYRWLDGGGKILYIGRATSLPRWLAVPSK